MNEISVFIKFQNFNIQIIILKNICNIEKNNLKFKISKISKFQKFQKISKFQKFQRNSKKFKKLSFHKISKF